MVATDRESAAFDMLHHGVENPAGVGAVADIIPEKDIALGAARLRVGQTRGECLAIGMHVGHQREHRHA